jgi:hypothetical protein
MPSAASPPSEARGELTASQRFQQLLGDIAMAMAIATYDPGYRLADRQSDYVHGQLRDDWLALPKDGVLRRRVLALANAGVGSLQQLPAEKLEAAAARYGIPLGAGLAKEMTEHFERRRTAVLTYRR